MLKSFQSYPSERPAVGWSGWLGESCAIATMWLSPRLFCARSNKLPRRTQQTAQRLPIHLVQPHKHTGIIHVVIRDVVERGVGGKQLRSFLEADPHHERVWLR